MKAKQKRTETPRQRDLRIANETTFGKGYTGPAKRTTTRCQNCGQKVGQDGHYFDETSCQA